jgi:hypothetical protein
MAILVPDETTNVVHGHVNAQSFINDIPRPCLSLTLVVADVFVTK